MLTGMPHGMPDVVLDDMRDGMVDGMTDAGWRMPFEAMHVGTLYVDRHGVCMSCWSRAYTLAWCMVFLVRCLCTGTVYATSARCMRVNMVDTSTVAHCVHTYTVHVYGYDICPAGVGHAHRHDAGHAGMMHAMPAWCQMKGAVHTAHYCAVSGPCGAGTVQVQCHEVP